MKKVKFVGVVLSLLVLMSFKSETNDKTEIVLGTYVQVENEGDKEDWKYDIVEIKLKKGGKALVKLKTNTKSVKAKWTDGDKFKNKAISDNIKAIIGIPGDGNYRGIILQYSRNGKGQNLLNFKTIKTKDGIFLKSGDLWFKRK